jgi:hypothetical protein
MTMLSLVLRAAALVPLAALAAQSPDTAPSRPSKPASFTLPAGEHGLTELVNLLGQIRKCEIACAAADLDAVDNQKVLLQRELQLSDAEFEDVVTTLLFYRGLVVVPGDRPGHQQAIAMLDKTRLQEAAAPRTTAEILARPNRLEFATTILPTDPSQTLLRLNMLRPIFAATGRPNPRAMTMQQAEGGIRLTGSTEQLACALKTIGLLDGVKPEPEPPIDWPAGTLPWPGGKTTLTKFLAAFTSSLDANVIGYPADREVDLGTAEQLPAADWWSRATIVLRSIDLTIVPVVAGSRVFLLRALNERGANEIQWRAAYEAPEALLQATAIVPVMTLHECEHVGFDVAMRAIRPAFGKPGGTLTVVSTGPRRALFVGLRDDVAKALRLVFAADQPK